MIVGKRLGWSDGEAAETKTGVNLGTKLVLSVSLVKELESILCKVILFTALLFVSQQNSESVWLF